MFLPTHLAAGLIIGKLTGDYTIALVGSVAMDLDHLWAYRQAGILFDFKKFFQAAIGGIKTKVPQRSFFHNIFFFLLSSAAALIISLPGGLIFSAAYLGHLFLDSLDNSGYFPFYPNTKINILGPIKYFSKQEFFLAFILLLIFLVLQVYE